MTPEPRRTPAPTLRQRRLGSALERLREDASLTKEGVAETLEVSPSTVWRWERAESTPRPRMLGKVLDLYCVAEPRRAQIMALAQDAGDGHGWWQPYEADMYPELVNLIALEAEASRIRTCESLLVPGLLQTEDYARAIVRGARPLPEHEVEQRVKIRTERQRVLGRVNPPKLWAIVDEAAVRRSVGGPAVMREQLRHLLAVTEDPNITLQIVPFAAGAHAGMDGPFVILDLPDAEYPGVVFIESLGGDVVLEDPTDLTRFDDAFQELMAVALSPADSLALVATLT